MTDSSIGFAEPDISGAGADLALRAAVAAGVGVAVGYKRELAAEIQIFKLQ